MHIRPHPRNTSRSKEQLTVAIPTVNRFSTQPAIDVIAITSQSATCLCPVLQDALTCDVLGKNAGTLYADLRALLLCRGAHREQKNHR